MTQQELALGFERVHLPLKSYLMRISASPADAEDMVHDTFIRASDKLDGFRGESSLKTWLFTIATNLAKENARVRKRWVENVTDLAREAALGDENFLRESIHIRMTSPQGHFEIKEHVAFCFTCISKSLPLEQQLCIFLKEVYEFKVSEIQQIIGSTEAMVKYYLNAGRTKMTQIFDGRCALINKEGVCHQCSELNGIFNPKQNTQEELVKLELVKAATNPDKEYLLDLRMQILKESDPFESPAAALQLRHMEFNRMLMDKN